jgi:hypothetical protein
MQRSVSSFAMKQRSYQRVSLEAVLAVCSTSAECSLLKKVLRDGKYQIFSFNLQCVLLDKCNMHVTLDSA